MEISIVNGFWLLEKMLAFSYKQSTAKNEDGRQIKYGLFNGPWKNKWGFLNFLVTVKRVFMSQWKRQICHNSEK